MEDDGGDQHQVAPQQADQSSPSWFGSWSWGRIVFVSDLDGTNDVWEVFPGNAPTSLHQTTFDEAQTDVSASLGLAFVRIKPDGESRIRYEDSSDYQGGDRAAPVTDRGDHTDSDPAWVSPAVWNAAFDAQAKENLTAAADAAQSIRDNSGSFSNAGTAPCIRLFPPSATTRVEWPPQVTR
jgi:hypothetical protein